MLDAKCGSEGAGGQFLGGETNSKKYGFYRFMPMFQAAALDAVIT